MIKCELIDDHDLKCMVEGNELNILNFVIFKGNDIWYCSSDEGNISSIFRIFTSENTVLVENANYQFTVTDRSGFGEELTYIDDVGELRINKKYVKILSTQALILGNESLK